MHDYTHYLPSSTLIMLLFATCTYMCTQVHTEAYSTTQSDITLSDWTFDLLITFTLDCCILELSMLADVRRGLGNIRSERELNKLTCS